MDIGSLVECVKLSGWEVFKDFDGLVTPKVKNIYMVRSFYKGETYTNVYLEEIVNKHMMFDNGIIAEPSFEMKCFREVLPPINVLEEIEKSSEYKLST